MTALALDPPPASFLTMPLDIILDILAVPVLGPSDFARLCLVSRQFLPLARSALYATVNCDYVLEFRYGTREVILCQVTNRTTELLRTLRESEQIRALVHSVRFRRLPAFSNRSAQDLGRSGLRGLAQSYMAVATNLSSVELEGIDGDLRTVTRQIFASPNCPTTIMFTEFDLSTMHLPLEALQPTDVPLDPNQQARESDEQSQVDSSLERLKYLQCGRLSAPIPKSGEKRASLSSLEELEISGDRTYSPPRPSYFRLEPTDFPHLQTLRIPFFHLNTFTSPQGVLPNLKRLYLATPSHYTEHRDIGSHEPKLERLSNFSSLEFISIGIYTLRTSINSGLSKFFANLPPHLTQIEFPLRAPFDILLSSANFVGCLDIGVTRPLDYEQKKKTQVERLREASRANGGSTYFVAKHWTRPSGTHPLLSELTECS